MIRLLGSSWLIPTLGVGLLSLLGFLWADNRGLREDIDALERTLELLTIAKEIENEVDSLDRDGLLDSIVRD